VERKKPARKREPRPEKESRWGFRGMTVRDWLPIVGALLIPVVVAAGTWWITWQQGKIADQRAEAERELAEQRAQDEALQAYLGQMTDLMLNEKGFRTSEPGDPIFTLARARTVTVITRLDSKHNKSVTRFLTESGLIGYDYQTGCTQSDIALGDGCSKDVTGDVRLLSLLLDVELRGADLEGAYLTGADFGAAILNDANLSNSVLYEASFTNAAQLIRTDLSNADLGFANLSTANLTGADLSGADLSNANAGEVVFKSVNLSDADLSDATLNLSVFNSADLSGADLSGATLPGADLTEANLSGATLTDADLTDARGVASEELEQQAKSLEGATMPNGQKYEDWLKSKGSGEGGENGGSS
jgi:uncharacterized protein YjbI with pentapeptide repeats